MNIQSFKSLTWLQVCAGLGGAAILLVAKKYVPDAYGDALTVLTGMYLFLRQAPSEPVPAPALIAKEEDSKPNLRIVSGLLLALSFCGAVTACNLFGLPQATQTIQQVDTDESCEQAALKVKAAQCTDGGPCQVGYDAYLACKKDGGV